MKNLIAFLILPAFTSPVFASIPADSSECAAPLAVASSACVTAMTDCIPEHASLAAPPDVRFEARYVRSDLSALRAFDANTMRDCCIREMDRCGAWSRMALRGLPARVPVRLRGWRSGAFTTSAARSFAKTDVRPPLMLYFPPPCFNAFASQGADVPALQRVRISIGVTCMVYPF